MMIHVPHINGVYPIYIQQNGLQDSQFLKEKLTSQRVMVITDSTVANLYLEPLLRRLNPHLCNHIILPDGEVNKNWENLQKILDALIIQGYHRDSALIALGGGVITDITGFAAACFHRGIDFFSIPTSLLAQVDASIGGKTAINHPLGKNLIGAFHQPKGVLIDIQTLATLPERHFRAGLAEIIKAALIKDEKFFIFLEHNLPGILNRDVPILKEMIHRACQIKVNIVSLDEKERNRRAILNFGHTFGHALEVFFNYQTFLHGEAVAIGMALAAKMSMKRGLSESEFDRIIHLIQKAGLPFQLPPSISLENLLPYLLKDKKISQEKIKFILLSRIGKAKIFSQEIKELAAHSMIA